MFLTRKVKSWLMLIAIIALTVGLVVCFVKLNRQTSSTRLGNEIYSVGELDLETGKILTGEDNKGSIITKQKITAKDLSVELVENAKITYKIFCYDEDGDFLGAVDNDNSLVENTKTVRIMITPTNDDDNKVGLFEIGKYGKQLIIVVGR